MTDLGTLTQQVVLEQITNSGGPERYSRALQNALDEIRSCYRQGCPPRFSESMIRAAYSLAYFPHHAALSAAAFAAAGTRMLGLRDGAKIAVLGAGPGPEVVGLAQYLAQTNQHINLEFYLVDREPKWSNTRKHTIDTVLNRIEGFDRSSCKIHTIEQDLASDDGIREVATLLEKVDLVVMETLLTELPISQKDHDLVDCLIKGLSHQGRLLLIDLSLLRQYQIGQKRLSTTPHLSTRLTSRVTFPAAETLPVIKENFFPPGHHPRRRIEAQIELYSRPNCQLIPLPESTPFILNSCQKLALDKLKSFFHGSEKIFVLDGPAGSGKTALFPAIVGMAQQFGSGVALMAPTGQAARRLSTVSSINASTIHSTIYTYQETLSSNASESDELDTNGFQLTAPESKNTEEKPPVAVFKLRDLPEQPAVYVIDEASLIGNRRVEDDAAEVIFGEGALLSDLLMFTLSHPDSRVIFVGDTEQLPPVGEQIPPALTAAELEDLTGCVPVIATLTQVMRQDGNSGVLDLANQVRLERNQRYLEVGPEDPESGINILGSNTPPDWVQNDILKGDSVVVAARHCDVARWNLEIRESVQRPSDLIVSEDRVIVLRNNSQRNLRNGDELVVDEVSDGIEVLRIKDETVRLREARFRYNAPGVGTIIFTAPFVEDLLYRASAKDQQRVSRILFVDFKIRHKHLLSDTEAFNMAYENDDRVNAIRISYCYARTCHRVQGGEWPQVVIDFRGTRWLGSAFSRWAYTAITRAKRSLWLANLPRPNGSLGSDSLLEGAEAALSEVNLEVVEHKTLPYGVRLVIAGNEGIVIVDLFEKKGKPSKVNLVNSDTQRHTESVLKILRTWINSQRANLLEPLPEPLERTALLLGEKLQALGYDFSYQPYADYQVEFTLQSADGAEAKALCFYNGGGRITSTGNTSGDLMLMKVLGESLGSVLV